MVMLPPPLMSSNLKQGKICCPVATQPPKPLSDRKGNVQSMSLPDQKLEATLHDPPTNTNNIGNLCNKTASLTDNQKYEFCGSAWRPDAKFVFPESVLYGKQRKFCLSWFQDYK